MKHTIILSKPVDFSALNIVGNIRYNVNTQLLNIFTKGLVLLRQC